VTSNEFKIRENEVFVQHAKLNDGRRVEDIFEFDVRKLPIKEVLEIDLLKMVRAEVAQAYGIIKIPCIVEHAGLVFEGYDSYPGGLTKPMWDFLKGSFIAETRSAGRGAIARAAIAYCDGRSIETFSGETRGKISDTPRGSRHFYWDTIFIPDDSGGSPGTGTMTYAEIVDSTALGLAFKMTKLSQSSRAMLEFLEYRLSHEPELWSYL
jgi:inosine/xanthosine triphosphate pyrophosphatase family protein